MRSLMPFQRTSKAWLKNCGIEGPITEPLTHVLGDNLLEIANVGYWQSAPSCPPASGPSFGFLQPK